MVCVRDGHSSDGGDEGGSSRGLSGCRRRKVIDIFGEFGSRALTISVHCFQHGEVRVLTF